MSSAVNKTNESPKKIKKSQVVDFYLTKSKEEISCHLKSCIDQVVRIQYKGYLRDIQIISEFSKMVSDDFKRIDIDAKTCFAKQMYLIERRLFNYKQIGKTQ